jgi:hypothetical protein
MGIKKPAGEVHRPSEMGHDFIDSQDPQENVVLDDDDDDDNNNNNSAIIIAE